MFAVLVIIILFQSALAMKLPGPLILGSSSATRKLILTNAGYTFTVCKADIDERAIGDRTVGTLDKASELVLLLGNKKTDAILAKLPADLKGRVLLCADQVITYKDTILEKPDSLEEARRFIKGYSKSACSTVGSIVLTDTSSGKRVSGVDISTIYFDEIPNEAVERILAEEDCMYCAGGLMIEHPEVQPYVRKIDPGTMEGVMGLSLDKLDELMKQLGSEDL